MVTYGPFKSMIPKFVTNHYKFSSGYLSALHTYILSPGRGAVNAYCPIVNLLNVYISWLI